MRAYVDMLIGQMNDLRVAMQTIVGNKKRGHSIPEKIVQQAEETMSKLWSYYDEILKKNKYIGGDTMTLVDSMLPQQLL